MLGKNSSALLVAVAMLPLVSLGDARDANQDIADHVAEITQTLTNIDDGVSYSGQDSSEIYFENVKGVTLVAQRGVTQSPYLLLIMRSPVSFDTFARCYGACNRILRTLDRKTSVYWTVGCRSERNKITGQERIVGGQLMIDSSSAKEQQEQEIEYRDRVIVDVVHQCQRLGVKTAVALSPPNQ